MTQTPLSIATDPLKYNAFELETLIQKEYIYWTQKIAEETRQL